MARRMKETPRQETAEVSTLTVVYRALSDLVPYANNARTHSDAEIEQLVASYNEFGWTNPILIDGDDGIIAGHRRYLMAQRIGLREAPCIVLPHLSAAQRRAYVLADNKLALNAGWDEEKLRSEIIDLVSVRRSSGLDFMAIGFSMDELRDAAFPAQKKSRSAASGLSSGLSYQIIIECDGDDQQAEILEELKNRGIKCKPLIL
jgi:hypothetical protein